MSNRPMEGVRVLEVAQYTFTPAAGAVMAVRMRANMTRQTPIS